MLRTVTTCAALSLPHLALADVNVGFFEGAPKDRFVISSPGGVCAEGPVEVTIDLNGSAGALIFDVESGGAGVEVFQPFELVAGGATVLGASRVSDGDRALTLRLDGMVAGAEVAFTIDLDDTIGAREITVAGGEIAGAVVRIAVDGEEQTGVFTDRAEAVVPWPACLS